MIKRTFLCGLLLATGLIVAMSFVVAAPVWSAQDDPSATPIPDTSVPDAPLPDAPVPDTSAPPVVDTIESPAQDSTAGNVAPELIVRQRIRMPLMRWSPRPADPPVPPVIKKGANGVASCDRLNMLGLRNAAYYNWGSIPPVCPGNMPVPMIWGANMRPADIVPSPYLLLFNECDRSNQCNATPETMAREWRYWEQRFPDRALVGPNISGDGWQWLHDWRAAYIRLYGQAPRMYALGYHCYGNYTECQRRIAEAIKLAQAWTSSGKVWLTEWGVLACPNGAAYSLSEAQKLRAWMDATPGVGTYMWFTTEFTWPEDPPTGFGKACNTPLIRDGKLTAWGDWYKR